MKLFGKPIKNLRCMIYGLALLILGCLFTNEGSVCVDGGGLVNKKPNNISGPDFWVPPVGLNSDGTINEQIQTTCEGIDSLPEPIVLTPGCLSLVYVSISQQYRAEINIYNGYGKRVHHSTQSFGYCGELASSNYMGYYGERQSWLVWNNRDDQGNLVPSGTYTWHITFKRAGGTIIRSSTYKTAYSCSDNSPGLNCAL